MTKNYLLFIALFLITPIIQSAEQKPQKNDKKKPEKGSFARRELHNAAPSSFPAQVLLSPSPTLPIAFTSKQEERLLPPRKPFGSMSNLKKPTRLEPFLSPAASSQAEGLAESEKQEQEQEEKERTAISLEAQAAKLYELSKAMIQENPFFDKNILQELNDLFDEREEVDPEMFLEEMQNFYKDLKEGDAQKNAQKNARKDRRRNHIENLRSALGIEQTNNVLFIDSDSQPGSLKVSPPHEMRKVMTDFQPIPYKDYRQGKKLENSLAKESLNFLIQEFNKAETSKEKNDIAMRMEAFLKIHPDLRTEKTDAITGSVNF